MRWSRRARLAVGLVAATGLLGLVACAPPKKPPPAHVCASEVAAAGHPHEVVPAPAAQPLSPDEAGDEAKAAVAEAEVRIDDGRVPLVMVEETPAGPEITTVPVASEAEAEAVAEQAAAAGNLVTVEPDSIVTVDAGEPNDPRFDEQYALRTARFVQTWAAFAPGFTGAGAGGGRVVAVLDTGVQSGHEDLAGKVVGPGMTYGGYGPATQDPSGHGTRVAGIIAAATDNSKGIAGAAPAAQIRSVRVLDHRGHGFTSDVARGIRWAADHAHVVNLSLGGPTHSEALYHAVRYAVFLKHVPVISASGNTGKCGEISFPAAYPEVLAVGSVDSANRWASFSTTASYVSVVAPGVNILSTTRPGPSTYDVRSGTSFSAPYVAAAAAIVQARHPSFNATQVYDRLIGTATDLGPRGWDPHFGWGLINVRAAAG